MRPTQRALMRLAALFVCLAATLSCPQFNGLCRADDPPKAPTSEEFTKKFKDADSKDDRKLVEETIVWTNVVLGKKNQFILQPSWKPEAVAAKKVVPVFLGLRRKKGEMTSVAFVPAREQCIIIEAKELPKLSILMGNRAPQAIQQSMIHLLTLALLHEMGHIVAGDNGCFDQMGDEYVIAARGEEEAKLRNERANFINDSKQKELDADIFAAKQLNEGKAEISDLNRISKSFLVMSSIPIVSFNLMDARMDKHPARGYWAAKHSGTEANRTLTLSTGSYSSIQCFRMNLLPKSS